MMIHAYRGCDVTIVSYLNDETTSHDNATFEEMMPIEDEKCED